MSASDPKQTFRTVTLDLVMNGHTVKGSAFMGLTDCSPPSGQSTSLIANQEGWSNIEHGKQKTEGGGRATGGRAGGDASPGAFGKIANRRWDRARELAVDTAHDTEDLMKGNLAASLILALGLGVLVGFMIRRSSE